MGLREVSLSLALLFSTAEADAQTGGISGTVNGPDGTPVVGASVEVRCGDLIATTRTDADGTFRFGDIPDGHCRVTADMTPLRPAVRQVTLSGSGTAPLLLTLAPNVSFEAAATGDSAFSIGTTSTERSTTQPDDVHSQTGLRLSHWWTGQSGSHAEGRPTTAFGPTWRFSTGATYETASGMQLTARVIGRRGFSAPLAMVQTLGSDGLLPDTGAASLDAAWASTLWDTQLAIRKPLKSTGAVEIALVGDVINLVNFNRTTSAMTPFLPAFTSRTFRLGLAFGF